MQSTDVSDTSGSAPSIAIVRAINAGIAAARYDDVVFRLLRSRTKVEPDVQPLSEEQAAEVIAASTEKHRRFSIFKWLFWARRDGATDRRSRWIADRSSANDAIRTSGAAACSDDRVADAEAGLRSDPHPQDVKILDALQALLLRDDVMQSRVRDLERLLADTGVAVRDLGRGLASLSSAATPLQRSRLPTLDQTTIGQLHVDPSRPVLADRIPGQERENVRAQGERPSVASSLADCLDHFAAQQTVIQAHVDLLLRRHVVDFGNVFAIRSDVGYLLVPSDDKGLVLALVESPACLEPGTLAIILDMLEPGDLVIDVGANVGTIALPVASALRGHGRVIAVEPIPHVAQLLRTTAMLNGLTDELIVEQFVAGDKAGSGIFYVDRQTTHSSSRKTGGDTIDRIETPVQPLDWLVPPGEPVRLVKIDVEGDELDVWRGMMRLLDENVEMAVIMELGPSHLKKRGIAPTEWLASLGVSRDAVWEIEEETGTLHPLRQAGLEELSSVNLLVVRAGLPASLRHRAG